MVGGWKVGGGLGRGGIWWVGGGRWKRWTVGWWVEAVGQASWSAVVFPPPPKTQTTKQTTKPNKHTTKHTQTHAHIHPPTHPHPHRDTHTHTHTHTQTRTHAHTHTHTPTPTHPHTQTPTPTHRMASGSGQPTTQLCPPNAQSSYSDWKSRLASRNKTKARRPSPWSTPTSCSHSGRFRPLVVGGRDGWLGGGWW
jgi:hypothetical protein